MKNYLLNALFSPSKKKSKEKKDGPTEYAMAIFNNMDPELIDILGLIVSEPDAIRVYFSSMSCLIVFKSTIDLDTLYLMVEAVAKDPMAAYMITRVDDAKLLYGSMYKRFMVLGDDNPANASISTLREFFMVISDLKNKITTQLEKSQTEGGAMIIDLDSIQTPKKREKTDTEIMDGLLDKINKLGMGSLDQEELEQLQNISKNGKKK